MDNTPCQARLNAICHLYSNFANEKGNQRGAVKPRLVDPLIVQDFFRLVVAVLFPFFSYWRHQ